MQVGIAELKDRLSEVVDRAERGEEVTITRHGRPVVTMTPAQRRPTKAELDQVFDEIRREGHKLPSLTDEELVAFVKADRRF